MSRDQSWSFEGLGDHEFMPTSVYTPTSNLYGKKNFLHHFITNYAYIKKGFMILLKKGVLFICDE